MVRHTLVIVDDFYCNPHEVAKMARTITVQEHGMSMPYMNVRGMQQEIQLYIPYKITDFSSAWSQPNNPHNGSILHVRHDREGERCLLGIPTKEVDTKEEKWGWRGILFLDDPTFAHRCRGVEISKDPKDPEDATTTVAYRFNRLVLFRGDRHVRLLVPPAPVPEAISVFQTFFFNTYDCRKMTGEYYKIRDAVSQYHVFSDFVEPAICRRIIAEAEEWAAQNGSWTTARHSNYPTTDIPVRNLAMGAELERMAVERVFPLIEEKFHFPLAEMSLGDFFVVKYDAEGQRELKWHRDVSLFSFNILLNETGDFVGGGTRFQMLDTVVAIEQGHLILHSGKFLHAGNEVTKGVRYIAVGFVVVKSARINTEFIARTAKIVLDDRDMVDNILLY